MTRRSAKENWAPGNESMSTPHPLLQAALISAAQRQVLVSVQYQVPPPDADSLTAQVITVQLLDQPIYLRARAVAMYLPTATRVIDGVKSTFPDKSIKAGALRALSVLESCTSSDRPGAEPPTIEDLAAAKKDDHVRFVFSLPIKVELLDDKIDVAELVFSEKLGFLVRDDDNVFYGTKYRHAPMDDFQQWYRQVLPAD